MDIQLNDEELTNIYNIYYIQIFKFIFSRINNYEESEDITQETFLKLIQNNYKKENIRTWLFVVAKNIIIDKYRKETNINEYKCKLHKDIIAKKINNMLSYELNIDYKPYFININNILKLLTNKQKNIIYLRFFKEFSVPEIRDLIGYSRRRIHFLIERGMSKMRDNIYKNN